MKKLLLIICFIAATSSTFAQSWVAQSSGFASPSRGISAFQVVDANTVWAYAYDGVTTTNNIQEFTRTINGGSNWTTGTINVGNTALVIGNLSAVNGTTAWVSAFDATNGGGGVWKTSDAGVTWTHQNTAGFTTANASWIDGVHFFDANIGVAFGDPLTTQFEVYRTTDGGTTWSTITTPAITAGDYGYSGSFATVGNNMWFTTAKGKIYKTTDQGLTWTKLNSPIADFGAGVTTTSSGKIFFSDANNGIIIGSTISGTGTTATVTGRTLYKTTNGGTTWATGVAYTQPYNYNLCYIPGTTTLVGTGVVTSGTTNTFSSAYSTNNGTSWTSIDSGTQRGAVAFFDGATGWSGGFNSDPFTGGAFKFSGNLINPTFDGNKSFNISPNPANTLVSISSTLVDSYKLKVVDLTGKVIIEKELIGVQNTLDVSALTSGMYFFTFTSDTKSETIKIIKN